MTFKYSVLLKARFGGPFVLSENTRLLLYMICRNDVSNPFYAAF